MSALVRIPDLNRTSPQVRVRALPQNGAVSENQLSGGHLIEQRLGLFQIERVEALGEPAIDRSEKIVGLVPLPLIAPQSSKARRRAQLPRFCLAPTGPKNSWVPSRVESLKAGFDYSDLFVDLTERQTNIIRAPLHFEVHGQFAPVHPEIFEGPSVAQLHIGLDNSFDG
jgi:hypothetical protein